MQILVHDSRFVPQDSDRFPRWLFLRGEPRHRLASGWSQDDGKFEHAPVESDRDEPDRSLDWLVYRHWDPVLNRYGPVRDHYGYNGGDVGADNVVPDLSLEARLTVSRDVAMIAVAIRSGRDRFVVRIPVTGDGSVEVVQ